MVKKLGILTKIGCNLKERVPVFSSPTRAGTLGAVRVAISGGIPQGALNAPHKSPMTIFRLGQEIICSTWQVCFMLHTCEVRFMLHAYQASLMLPDAKLLSTCPAHAVLSLLIFHE